MVDVVTEEACECCTLCGAAVCESSISGLGCAHHCECPSPLDGVGDEDDGTLEAWLDVMLVRVEARKILEES